MTSDFITSVGMILMLAFFSLGCSQEAVKENQTSTRSKIVETNRIAEVLNYVKPDTLILFDIDNTLIEPLQTLGSDQWFSWRIKYYEKQGYSSVKAIERALIDWIPAICLTQVKVVEPHAASLVKRLQDEDFTVMGLTTRSAILRTPTLQQLESVDIKLSRTAPAKEELIFLNPYEVIFKEGILFTSGTDKGHALFKFLELNKEKYPAEKIGEILFINDKQSNLEEVQRACALHNISFVGLRYGYLDEKVRNFSEEIAETQFRQFARFLPDEEAGKPAVLGGAGN